MAAMNDYVIWAAEEIEKDYPGHKWEFYVHIVTNTRICETIHRYSLDRYMELHGLA